MNTELLSLYDPRHLEHRTEELERLQALREQFDRDGAPRVVEIGSNRGDFLAGLAARHAPSPVLGIEWRAKQCELARERLARRGVENAIVLHADAKLALPVLFEPEQLDAVHVLFPDPWWKSRHASRRLLTPMFLRIIARRLAKHGALYLKSDVFDYLYQVRASVELSEAMAPLPPERWPDEADWARSTRERKCMQSAIPFGRGYYRRRPGFDTARPEQPEPLDAFPAPEEVDPVAIIRGAPPVDQKSKGRRR